MSAWQSMDSAPKDGRSILLDWPNVSCRPVVGWWVEEWNQWQGGNYYCGARHGLPLRWHECPEVPK